MKSILSRNTRLLKWGVGLAILSCICYQFFFKFTPNNWVAEIPKVGFSSSIRPVDLNEDGILDLVIGAGGEEFTRTENGVIALDGKDGTVLWRVPTRNQVAGSAQFQDITSDGIPDVFIGGRSAILLAIDGLHGKILWEFLPDFPAMDLVNDTMLLNFFTPQFIPDRDGDGLDDLLISFGGFIKATATEKDRPSGRIMIVSSKDGRVLSTFLMPDQAESYMSPLVFDFGNTGQMSVIFGSGGETMEGHLYKIPLDDLYQNDASRLKIIASGKGKGFIAPPVLADVNLDGVHDIIANPVNGNMICIDGATEEIIWELAVDPVYEVYTSPAPGFFSGDDLVPDFVTSLGAGPWPDTDYTLHLVIDGKNGEIIFKDTLGLFQYASPIVFDFSDDGEDDILLAINERRVLSEISTNAKFYVNDLKILDLSSASFYNFGKSKLGSNLGTTPLITDLDGDQRLDIIYCYMADANNFYSFERGKIERFELKLRTNNRIPWGAYMGKHFDGVFTPE